MAGGGERSDVGLVVVRISKRTRHGTGRRGEESLKNSKVWGQEGKEKVQTQVNSGAASARGPVGLKVQARARDSADPQLLRSMHSSGSCERLQTRMF